MILYVSNFEINLGIEKNTHNLQLEFGRFQLEFGKKVFQLIDEILSKREGTAR